MDRERKICSRMGHPFKCVDRGFRGLHDLFQYCFPLGLKKAVEKVPMKVLIGYVYHKKFEVSVLTKCNLII